MIRSTSLPLVAWAFSPAFLKSRKSLRTCLWSFLSRTMASVDMGVSSRWGDSPVPDADRPTPSGTDDPQRYDDRVTVAVGEHRMGLRRDHVAELDVARPVLGRRDVHPDQHGGGWVHLVDLDLGD